MVFDLATGNMSQTPTTITQMAMKPRADVVDLGMCCLFTGYFSNDAPYGGCYCHRHVVIQSINWCKYCGSLRPAGTPEFSQAINDLPKFKCSYADAAVTNLLQAVEIKTQPAEFALPPTSPKKCGNMSRIFSGRDIFFYGARKEYRSISSLLPSAVWPKRMRT
jgi:hypothetical protein